MLRSHLSSAFITLLVSGTATLRRPAEAAQLTAGEQSGHLSLSQVELAAREGTVEQFATAVAGVRIPLGIVIEGVNVAPLWKPSWEAVDRLPADFDGDVLGAFKARHPYNVRLVNGVYRIEPKSASKCVAAAERRFEGLITSGSAADAVDAAVRAFNHDHTPAPPVGVAVMDSGDARAADIFKTPVALQLADVSLADVLDNVIKSVPGLGWAVREEPDRPEVLRNGALVYGSATHCNVTLFSGDGWGVTSWNIVPEGSAKTK